MRFGKRQASTLGPGVIPPDQVENPVAINRMISKQQREDSQRFERKTRVLLLGTGNSGKTTFLKLMQQLYDDTYADPQERMVFRPHILANMNALAWHLLVWKMSRGEFRGMRWALRHAPRVAAPRCRTKNFGYT